MYLGIHIIKRFDKFSAERCFPSNAGSHNLGTLSDGNTVHILLDRGPIQISMFKTFYASNAILHSLSKFKSKAKIAQVGNCQHVPILFIIPDVVTIHGIGLKFTLWSVEYVKLKI